MGMTSFAGRVSVVTGGTRGIGAGSPPTGCERGARGRDHASNTDAADALATELRAGPDPYRSTGPTSATCRVPGGGGCCLEGHGRVDIS